MDEDKKTDLEDRAGITLLVDDFYRRVRADESLGYVFDDIAKVDWEAHLPKICDFWDTIIFRAGTFKGDPLAIHAKLLAETDLPWPLFELWLELFRATVNEHFAGENAGHIIRSAEDMAGVIYSKIHNVPNPRLDPSLLTPEQKARFAKYRREIESQQSDTST